MIDEPVMQIEDEETGQMRDWPSNYLKKYSGPMTIVDAVRTSINTIPVELIQSLTPKALTTTCAISSASAISPPRRSGRTALRSAARRAPRWS